MKGVGLTGLGTQTRQGFQLSGRVQPLETLQQKGTGFGAHLCLNKCRKPQRCKSTSKITAKVVEQNRYRCCSLMEIGYFLREVFPVNYIIYS